MKSAKLGASTWYNVSKEIRKSNLISELEGIFFTMPVIFSGILFSNNKDLPRVCSVPKYFLDISSVITIELGCVSEDCLLPAKNGMVKMSKISASVKKAPCSWNLFTDDGSFCTDCISPLRLYNLATLSMPGIVCFIPLEKGIGVD